jgi:hypothetical protein
MASLYVKQNKLWARYKDEEGRWTNAPTPYRPGQEAEAKRYVTRLQRQTDAAREVTGSGTVSPSTMTVTWYARRWIEGRRPLCLETLGDDEARLRKHVLPRIGEMLLREVRPRHIRGLIKDLRAEGKLAPRTIYQVFFTVAVQERCG